MLDFSILRPDDDNISLSYDSEPVYCACIYIFAVLKIIKALTAYFTMRQCKMSPPVRAHFSYCLQLRCTVMSVQPVTAAVYLLKIILLFSVKTIYSDTKRLGYKKDLNLKKDLGIEIFLKAGAVDGT